MSDFIKELDDLLKKYNITIYDVMQIYEKQFIKPVRTVQHYNYEDHVWTYYNPEGNNPCGCGSNCYHYEYDQRDDEIYGVCNGCDKDIYIIDKKYKNQRLEIGVWKWAKELELIELGIGIIFILVELYQYIINMIDSVYGSSF